MAVIYTIASKGSNAAQTPDTFVCSFLCFTPRTVSRIVAATVNAMNTTAAAVCGTKA